MSQRIRERGEGKVGCIVSLAVLVITGAVGLKVVPVFYSNNALKDAALRKAEAAGGRELEAVTKEIISEARNLEIAEATRPGAITVSKRGGGADGGTITVNLRYTRSVDLFGVYTWPIETNEKIERPIFENIR